VRSTHIAGLLLVLVVLLVTTGTARAQEPGQLVPGGVDRADRFVRNADQIARWLYHGNPAAANPVGMPECGKVCTDLWLAEHRPIPGQPASKTMWRSLNQEIRKARIRTAGLNLGKTVVGKLGVTGAAFTAGQVGWWVGSSLRPLFYGTEAGQVTAAPAEFPRITTWTLMRPGDLIGSASWPGYSVNLVVPPIAPEVWVASFNTGTITGYGPETCDPVFWPQLPALGMPQFDAKFADGLGMSLNGGQWVTDGGPFTMTCPNPNTPNGLPTVQVTTRRTMGTYVVPWVPAPPVSPLTAPSPAIVSPREDGATVTTVETYPHTQPSPGVQLPSTVDPWTDYRDGVVTIADAPGDAPVLTAFVDSVIGTAPNPVDEPETVTDPEPSPQPNPEPTPDPNRPAPGADSRCGPAPPAVNFAPLSVGLGEKFPFGAPMWVLGALTGWAGSGTAPRIEIPMPGEIDALVIDMAPIADPLMAILRPVILICAMLALVWLFCSSALGFGGGNDD
jgi:hypothetical protein